MYKYNVYFSDDNCRKIAQYFDLLRLQIRKFVVYLSLLHRIWYIFYQCVSWFTNSVKLSTKLCFNAVITKILTGKRFLYDFHQTNFCSITTLFRTKYHFWPSAKEAIKKIMKCLQHKPSIPIYSFCLESHFCFCHITIFQCWKCDEIEGLFVFPYLVKYVVMYIYIKWLEREGYYSR